VLFVIFERIALKLHEGQPVETKSANLPAPQNPSEGGA
jgi:hypothetical protein